MVTRWFSQKVTEKPAGAERVGRCLRSTIFTMSGRNAELRDMVREDLGGFFNSQIPPSPGMAGVEFFDKMPVRIPLF